jgi:hypothetical protein
MIEVIKEMSLYGIDLIQVKTAIFAIFLNDYIKIKLFFLQTTTE